MAWILLCIFIFCNPIAAQSGELGGIGVGKLGELVDIDANTKRQIQTLSCDVKTQRLAEEGNVLAQTKWATCHELGVGMPENEENAILWYHRAAKKGLVLAQAKLAFICYERSHTQAYRGKRRSNEIGAYAWLSILASQGYAWAKESRDYVSERFNPTARRTAQRLASRYWHAYVLQEQTRWRRRHSRGDPCNPD